MMRRLILLLVAIITILTASLFAFSPQPALAVTKDSGDAVLQTVPDQTVADKISSRTRSSWPWYVTRASGMVAAFTLTILMLSGIGQVTGHTFKFLDPLTAWASHRALGITFGISVLIHMFSLLFDKFIPFTILQIFIPWLSDYRPAVIFGVHVGTLWVALGVLAFYLSALVVITSLVWVEKKPYIWKLIHLISYLIILFVFVHALYIGTDVSHGFFRLLWWGIGIAIVIASLVRLWRAKTT